MAKRNVWEVNWASNKKIMERIRVDLPALVKRTMDDRVALEEDWLEYFRMWNVQKDTNNYYKGNARLYIPEVRKNIEAKARELTESAFPNDQYLTCIPGKGGTNEGADLQLQFRKWQIMQSGLQWKMHIFNRQKAMLGTSAAYVPWRSEKRWEWASSKSAKGVKPKFQQVDVYNGPDFEVVNMFMWYALNPLHWQFQNFGCFENKLVDRFELEKRNKAGEVFEFQEIDKALGEAMGKTELARFIQMIEASNLIIEKGGYSGEARLPTKDEVRNKHILHTEVYCFMELPEACVEDEDPSQPIPVVVDIYNSSHIGNIKRNKFFHQQAPYVASWYIPPNAGEFYGSGQPKATRYMQHEVNSKAEQGMDSATLALNPIAIIDPAKVGNMDEFLLEPGAKWFADPSGVKLAQIPDVTPVAYQAISQLRAQIQDFSDRTPALPSQFGGKARTAFQADIVNQAQSIDSSSFLKFDELLVFQPLMIQWQYLTDQNVEDKQILYFFGDQYNKAKQILVRKNKMLGKYMYQWVAAQTIMNRQIISSQIINFLKVIATAPPAMIQQSGINLGEICRFLWRDGFNLPNYQKVFGSEYDESTDPEVEHAMLREGMEIQVSPGDDDAFHIKVHDQDMKAKDLDDAEKEQLAQHIAQHQKQMQQKQMVQQLKQQQAQAMAQQQQQTGYKARNPGSGNRTQVNQNANVSNASSGIRP